MHDGYSSTNNAIQTIVNNLRGRGLCAGSINGGRGTSGNIIVVRARGTAGSEQIRLNVGGTAVQTWTLSTGMSSYTASTSSTGGIAVEFINDADGRDVQVDYIQVNGTTRQAENQTSNTGVWKNSFCGGSNSEWLHCGGYIGFGNVSARTVAVVTNGKTKELRPPVGIEVLNHPEIQLYPNPTVNGQFSVSLLGLDGVKNITISDMSGRVVQRIRTSRNMHQINLNTRRGIYFMKVSNSQQSLVKRIVAAE